MRSRRSPPLRSAGVVRAIALLPRRFLEVIGTGWLGTLDLIVAWGPWLRFSAPALQAHLCSVQATLQERKCPGTLQLVPLVCYVMVCSHVSTAPQWGPPGPIVPVPQGQFQDQRGAPLSDTEHNPTGPAGTTSPSGPRFCPPTTSGPPALCRDPSSSADQRGWQQPGSVIDSIPRRALWCPGLSPTLPQRSGSVRRDQCIPRSLHLPARPDPGPPGPELSTWRTRANSSTLARLLRGAQRHPLRPRQGQPGPSRLLP
ncbi:hypothetical protein NDU88_001468 [Pleurodeles waltl]|uniref:Uncharacterized protein n=1 Tax=Pleurodeles waltl TaxID=8319 RepID=A0AAV7VWJ7_PLEWA|nr:hypothetical protein NDU88_001468 [Pleurodeles waltl]